jgi:DNA-binding transcriptional LysR family regulator
MRPSFFQGGDLLERGELEDELGVTLIERGSRPVCLTGGGRLVYEQAVQVLERVEETKAIARRLQEACRLRFSLGFVPSTLYGYLHEVIRRYRGARPGVELTPLELLDLPPGRRLRHMQQLRRAGEISFARDCHEIAELA